MERKIFYSESDNGCSGKTPLLSPGLSESSLGSCSGPTMPAAQFSARAADAYVSSQRDGSGSSLWKVMSSKLTARACQPGREAISARTTCASVTIRTLPRPKGL